MRNISVEETCDCPMECSYISYSFSVVSTPFDANKLCPGKNRKADFLMKEFYENPFPPKFIRKLIQLKRNESSAEAIYCKRNIKYRAAIEFKLATNQITVTYMSRRLTLFDKVSAFGKVQSIYVCNLYSSSF